MTVKKPQCPYEIEGDMNGAQSGARTHDLRHVKTAL